MRYTTSYPMFNQFVKYSLISLLSLMILCTTLAILLVCLASVDYNNNLNDRSMGIIIVLIIITIVFLLGLIGVSKSHFPTVLLFSCADLFLLVITYYGSASTRGANLGAFLIFLITTVLSFIYTFIIWRKYISNRSATTERLLHPTSAYEDYTDYDYDNPAVTSPHLSFHQSSTNYEHNFNEYHEYQQQPTLGSQWTVESYDSKQLIGERYAV